MRPSVWPPFALAVLGLFQDVLWGGALGLWPLCLLTVYGLAFSVRRVLVRPGLLGLVEPGMAPSRALGFAAGLLLATLVAGGVPSLIGVGLQFGVIAACCSLRLAAHRPVRRRRRAVPLMDPRSSSTRSTSGRGCSTAAPFCSAGWRGLGLAALGGRLDPAAADRGQPSTRLLSEHNEFEFAALAAAARPDPRPQRRGAGLQPARLPAAAGPDETTDVDAILRGSPSWCRSTTPTSAG